MDKPRFDKLALDHAIWVIADYMTESIKRKRKGDLAVAALEISSALRDLVIHISKRASHDAVAYLKEREKRE